MRRTGGLLCAMLAGPLALAAFFMPWLEGRGLLVGQEFTGFELLRFTGALQQLELSPVESVALVAVRAAIVLVPVAATWQTILAATGPGHVLYRWSRLYLAASAAMAVAGAVLVGREAPGSGVLLLVAASLASFAPLVARERTTEATGMTEATGNRRQASAASISGPTAREGPGAASELETRNSRRA